MMEVLTTDIPDVLLMRPKIFTDGRGHFLETFNERIFREATGCTLPFVQDNESRSHRKVLRGLHYQATPHEQGKLVRVVCGAVLDVVVDIRPDSATFGRHVKVPLDDVTKAMLWIPPGLAHGFLCLTDGTVFCYKCTAYYAPQAERTILWNDPELAIDWSVTDPLVSAKDQAGIPFSSLSQGQTH